MSFYGSLYTGVAGMMAQAKSTAMISTNIANSTTVGYKRSNATFSDIVTKSNAIGPGHTSGSVTASRAQRITAQGGLQQTSLSTDAAIQGRGFFAVKREADPDAQFFYTRNGQFDVVNEGLGTDAQGYMRNSAGMVLYAWPLDETGTIVGGPDTGSLQPVNLSSFTEIARPTSAVEAAFNLDADQTAINPHRLLPGQQQLPVSAENAHFTRTITVYDGAGSERRLTIEARKITGPMAHFSTNLPVQLERDQTLVDNAGGPTPGISNGDSLNIAGSALPLTVTFVTGPADTSLDEATTVQDLINVINNHNGGNDLEARISENGQLIVQAVDPTVTLDISATSASVLGNTGLRFIQDPDGGGDYSYEPDASLTANGPANPNQSDFPAFANITSPNTQNWWEVRIMTNDPAAPTSGAQVEISKGLLNFDGDGRLNAARDPVTNLPLDGTIDLGTINFDDAAGDDDTAITLDIGRFTQYGGGYSVIFTEQNGAPIGEQSGFEIDRDGTIVANYTNGLQAGLYRIPLVTFTAEDALEDHSGTMFSQTERSGDPIVNFAGENGAGNITPSHIENSNVDIADEFAGLIVSQRAYSANSRTVTVLDQMMQTTSRLKR